MLCTLHARAFESVHCIRAQMPFIDMEEGNVLHDIEDDVKIFQDRIGAVLRDRKQMKLMVDRHEQASRAAQGMWKDAGTIFHEYQTQATAVISELQSKLKHSLAKQSALEIENLALKDSLQKQQCLGQDEDFMQLANTQENINTNMGELIGEDASAMFKNARQDVDALNPDLWDAPEWEDVDKMLAV